MSMATALQALATGLQNAYAAISTGGGTVPQNKNAANLAVAIATIPTGITPTGTVNIAANGTVDVTNYARASVAVPKYSIFTYTGNTLSNSQQVNSFVSTLLPTKGSVTLVNCKERISDFSENELCTFTTSNIITASSATRVRSGTVQQVTIGPAYDLALANGMQFYLQKIELEEEE
ncbi:MAG: hypothetical protein IKE65_02715 [Clostridia bacterium]|nr:hypothetical protein [Clostridia bacterium]